MINRYRFMPEFTPDEAAALWCNIEPDTQDADHLFESAYRAASNADYRRAILACASPMKKRYISIYLMIHAAMATTNESPLRKDKIARQKLIEIANKLKEKPPFLFPDGEPSPGSAERTKAQQRQVDLIEKVRKLMQHELDTTWPEGQRGLKIYVITHHYQELQRIYSRNASTETMAGKTKPTECKKLRVSKLPA